MLIGREHELSEAARALAGEALALVGEAGVGKTAMLAEFCRYADRTVLSARGVERESELPFAGLADIVAPLLGGLDRLPPPQRSAIAGALALEPPSPGDRFAVCVAARGLAGSFGQPLLIAVDDLQWLDEPSRECVEYLARRPPPGVAVLVTMREDPPAAVPVLTLEGLDGASARALLARHAGDLAPLVADELAATAAGNPLALIELPALLSPDQRAGRAPPPGPAGARARGRPRVRRPDRRAARAGADGAARRGRGGLGDLVPVARALAALGVESARSSARRRRGWCRSPPSGRR